MNEMNFSHRARWWAPAWLMESADKHAARIALIFFFCVITAVLPAQHRSKTQWPRSGWRWWILRIYLLWSGIRRILIFSQEKLSNHSLTHRASLKACFPGDNMILLPEETKPSFIHVPIGCSLKGVGYHVSLSRQIKHGLKLLLC